ncbi:MAG: peptidylprolyl isomerase [Candidatus Hydrogenedentes bacterium]|nr:peptidylprolyl isomerase [Candidatus Hydrogenedentota bacterium]
MSKFSLVAGALIVGVVIIGFYSWYFAQPRLTDEHMAKAQEVLEKIKQIEEIGKESSSSDSQNTPENSSEKGKGISVETAKTSEKGQSNSDYPDDAIPPDKMPSTVPDVFKVRFECSHGNFVIECHKDWAPIGIERFYELLKNKFYDDARFFRVVPGFVVQFGIAGEPALNAKYGEKTIKDDPVKQSNLRGMVTYAKTQLPNSRSTQIFINLVDNPHLDSLGFAPFGKVIEGMEVVERTNPKYREKPDQTMIRLQGNEYLNRMFPDLDYIKRAYMIK